MLHSVVCGTLIGWLLEPGAPWRHVLLSPGEGWFLVALVHLWPVWVAGVGGFTRHTRFALVASAHESGVGALLVALVGEEYAASLGL